MKMSDLLVFPDDHVASSITIETMETDDDFGVEAELTSLSWLQSLDITSASSLPTPPCSPSPPPITKQPPKKMSPLMKAQLGKFDVQFIFANSINAIVNDFFVFRFSGKL